MTSTRAIPRRHAQSGQFIIIYIMGFFTMASLAFATLSVGQIVVRKQWAQLIADAGAFAGASTEAEGLNTIAKISDFEFYLLRGIQARDRQIGYEVSSWTDMCFKAYLSDDKAGDIRDRHKNIDNLVFGAANLAVDSIQYDFTGLVPGSRGSAYKNAREVTIDNLKSFFPGEFRNDNDVNGIVNPHANAKTRFGVPSQLGYAFPLADLTDYFGDSVAWFYWTTDSGPCYWGVCAGYVCAAASYVSCDVSGVAGNFGTGNHDDRPDGSRPWSSYEFKKVMRLMEKDGETTFLWWVQIPAVRPFLGLDNVLGMIPPITAVSRAKPYEGNIGFNSGGSLNDKNEVWPKRKAFAYFSTFPFTAIPPAATWNVQWHMEKTAKLTYKAKFIPVYPARLREDTIITAELLASYSGGNSNRKVLEALTSIAH